MDHWIEPWVLLSWVAGSCEQSSEHCFLGVSGGSQICIVKAELTVGLEVKLLCVHQTLMVNMILVILVRHQRWPLDKQNKCTIQVFKLFSWCCDKILDHSNLSEGLFWLTIWGMPAILVGQLVTFHPQSESRESAYSVSSYSVWNPSPKNGWLCTCLGGSSTTIKLI